MADEDLRPDDLTDSQKRLLQDLAALQRAGLISAGENVPAGSGYDEGSIEVDIPATVTWKGLQMVEAISKEQG